MSFVNNARKRALVTVLLFSALVRWLAWRAPGKNFYLSGTPVLDAKMYDDWAMRIVKGERDREVYFLNPGYPFFLSVIYRAFGHNRKAVIFIQHLGGLLTVFLVFLLAEKFWNLSAAFISALIFGLYRMNLFYESSLLSSALINLVNTAFIFFLLNSCRQKSAGRRLYVFISGVLLGYSVLLRPNVLLFALPAALWIYLEYRRRLREAGSYLTLFFAGIIIVIFPVTLRNYSRGGEFVITTSSMGINFFTGNNPESNGANQPPSFVRSSPEEMENDFMREAREREKKDFKKSELSSYWFRRGLSFIKEEPLSWLKLMLRKTSLFFNYFEAGGNFEIYFSSPGSGRYLPHYGILLSLGLLGFLISVVKFSKLWLFYAYLAYYFAVVVSFFVLSEYRFPVVPALALFTGPFFTGLYGLFRNRVYLKLIALLLLAGSLFYTVNSRRYELREEVTIYNMASLALEEGRLNEAITGLLNAVSIHPGYDEAWTNLGLAYSKTGEFEKGLAALSKAISLRPQNPDNYLNMGLCLAGLGKHNEAVAVTEKSIALGADKAKANNNIGVIFFKNRDYAASRKYYQAAIKENENYHEAYNNLGAVYATEGRLKEALPLFRKALSIMPEYESARKNLLRAEGSANEKK